MFDALTRDQLYDLHTSLFRTHKAIHSRMVGPSPELKPLISPLSDDWAMRAAACVQITETMQAVNDEIGRREQETEPRLDGCTCDPVRGSHRPGCAWAASRA